MTATAPEPLSDRHDLSDFSSGIASLDDWLRRRALENQASDASRTYVVCEAGRVIGYYALASSNIITSASTGRFRRNMPEPIPVVVLARLAIDRAHQGRGLGRALFRDCAVRVLNAAETIGIRGLILHAISDDARAFCIALGFDPSPIEPMTLMVTLADLRDGVR